MTSRTRFNGWQSISAAVRMKHPVDQLTAGTMSGVHQLLLFLASPLLHPMPANVVKTAPSDLEMPLLKTKPVHFLSSLSSTLPLPPQASPFLILSIFSTRALQAFQPRTRGQHWPRLLSYDPFPHALLAHAPSKTFPPYTYLNTQSNSLKLTEHKISLPGFHSQIAPHQ